MTLAALQRQFCAWLREGDEARASAMATQLGLGPGLAVYQNNYRVALVEALRETHARVAQWLGDAAFTSAAARFIDADPPSDWTIDSYGAGFPALLRRSDPIAADLAAIDRAVGTVFVAADTLPADATALAGFDWAQAVIPLIPSLVLLPIGPNADALWLALASDEPVPDPQHNTPATLMLWRQGFEPVMRRAQADECRMVELSRSGVSFAAICAQWAQEGDEAQAVTRAGTVLGRWLGEGLIAA
jgi:hypothetical protein